MLSLMAPDRHRYVLTVDKKPIASSDRREELEAYVAWGFGRNMAAVCGATIVALVERADLLAARAAEALR